MADKNYSGERVVTTKFRAAFMSVFEPTITLNKEERYTVTMLFPKGDPGLAKLRAAAQKVAINFFGGEAKIPKNLKNPFKDGDVPNTKGTVYDGFEGCISILAWSKNKPEIVDRNKTEILSKSELKSGDYCRASVTPFAYNHPVGGPGIGFFLGNIQKLETGEPFGSFTSAEDDFDAVEPVDDDGAENTSLFGDKSGAAETNGAGFLG